MSKFQSFIGKWEMMPNENKYQIGAPPQEGTYTISQEEDNTLRFDIDWVDEQDQKHTMVYFSQVESNKNESEKNDNTDYVEITLTENNTLEISTYKDGIKICYNLQKSIENGKKLLIMQVGLLPDGGHVVNKSIYKKISQDTY